MPFQSPPQNRRFITDFERRFGRRPSQIDSLMPPNPPILQRLPNTSSSSSSFATEQVISYKKNDFSSTTALLKLKLIGSLLQSSSIFCRVRVANAVEPRRSVSIRSSSSSSRFATNQVISGKNLSLLDFNFVREV
jgi:hypothetical protein